MKLHASTTSPYTRKVRVALIELGLADTVALVPTVTLEDEGYRVVNPLGKIPALVLQDGRAIYDSRVITRYLDARAQAGLYPEDRIWDVLTLEATADGILEAAVLMVYEGRVRPEAFRYGPWVEAQWGKANSALKAINDGMMDQLSGPLDMGQIAVGCALGYLDFRHSDRDWRAECPALAEWYAEFETRPGMAATRPEG